MEQQEMDLAVRMVNVGLSLLKQRVMLFLALMLTFALFAWSVYQPDPFRIVASTIFGFVSYIMTKPDKRGEQ